MEIYTTATAPDLSLRIDDDGQTKLCLKFDV